MSIGALNGVSLNRITIDTNVLPNVGFQDSLCFGEFNSQALDVSPVDGCGEFVNLLPKQVIKFSQRVGTVISNEVIRFAQNVGQSISISGQVITINQQVKSYISGKVFDFTEIVGDSTFYSSHGYDVNIIINGVLIDPAYIKGDVIITKEAGKAVLCEFKMGASDPYDFIYAVDGGSILINFRDSSGWHRVFTGIIDTPEIDLINKYLTIKCSDRREELILSKMTALLPTIGRYATAVQGLINNVSSALAYRLETVPADVDFDSFNNPDINSWYPKVSADFTLGNSQVYYREPKVVIQSRASVINNIILNVRYQYTRLYHHQRQFTWTTPADVLSWGFNSNGTGPSWRFDNGPVGHATAGMVKQAISSAKWKEFNTLTYTDDYADWGYNANFSLTFGGSQLNLLNEDIGTIPTPTPTNPNAVYLYSIPPNSVDETRILSAAWQGSTRFSQNIEETHILTIRAPQSISQFGAIPSANQMTAPTIYTTAAPFDTTPWDNYENASSAPSGATHVGNSYWVNEDNTILPVEVPMFTATNSLAEFNNTVLTAIDRAKTQILASHRNTKVLFEAPILPTLELRHTVAVNSTKVTCQGKVTKIVQTISMVEKGGNTTQVEISLFKSRGSAVTTVSTVPTRPTDTISLPTADVVLGNHMGLNPDLVSGSDSWNGFIGNATAPFGTSIIKTSFREQFRVDTPAVPSNLTANRALTTTGTYDIAIPNDNLDMNF